jgi:hypothetical protein
VDPLKSGKRRRFEALVTGQPEPAGSARRTDTRFAQGELLFPMLVPHEEVERIGRIAQGGQNGLDSDVSKDIVWSDVSGDAVGGMPPGVQR